MAITPKRNAGQDVSSSHPVHAPAPIKKKKSFIGWYIGILIVLLLAVAVASYAMGQKATSFPVTHISQIFADVNGDGKMDLILNADVIINNGQVSFPVSQP